MSVSAKWSRRSSISRACEPFQGEGEPGELANAQTEDTRLKRELQTLKSQHGEAALPVGTAENPFLTQFYALRSDMDATKSQLQGVEGRLQAVQAEMNRQSPQTETDVSTTENPVAAQLQGELAGLEKDLLLARTKYTDKHRKVQDIQTQIADARQRLSRESERTIARRTVGPNPIHVDLKQQFVQLGTEKASLSGRLSALSAAMAEDERKAAELADSSVVLMAKTHEYDTAEARLSVLKQMVDQARVDEKVSSSAGEIQVIGKAQAAIGPVTKSGPSPFQLLLLGVVLSIGLAVGTALALAFLDDRVQAREDLARELGLPVIAVIPQLTDGYARVPAARVTEMLPLSPHAEAFRFLRTELTHFSDGDPLRSVLVATARPEQGGSTTAVNLAIALAEIGHRVVLVDADMRRPGLHSLFGQDNEAGLTTLLTDGGHGAQQALRSTEIENLMLLPAGPAAPNPAALLGSERMGELIAELESSCDYVVVDAPSAAAFADAALLGPLVDGVVLVFRANQPIREVDRRTKELLQKVGAKVLGAVLNDAPGMTVDSFYFRRHSPTPPALGPEGGPASGGRPVLVAGDGGAQPAPRAAATTALVQTRRKSRAAEAADRPRLGPLRIASMIRQHPRFGVSMVAGVTLVLLVVGYTGLRATRHTGRAPVAPGASPAPGAAAPGVTVTAVVTAPTDVRVEVDGRLLYDGPLSVGQLIWKGSREVTVWADRPEVISVSVNGHDRGLLGRAGGGPTSWRLTAQDAAADASRAPAQPATGH
jgi:tyrosine-protein kinase Etk/Wzc